MEKSSWCVTEGGKCGGLGAVSDLVILNRLCLARGWMEIWDQSQERNQSQMDESGNHYMEVKAKCYGHWEHSTMEEIGPDRDLSKLGLPEGAGRLV